MKVVIIGATGHIGTWLVPRLARKGHEVIAVSRGLREPYQRFTEWSTVRRFVIDRISAEADGSFGKRILELNGDVVVDLTCFTVEQAEHLARSVANDVKHFIHCGTLWVHGVLRTRPCDETTPREPFGEYGIRKAEIERYLLELSRQGFPATVLHPGHITGPGWTPINPAGNLDVSVFALLSRGDEIMLPDDGLATLQHVHADDVAQAFELAIENREKSIGEAFHVAAAEPVTMRAYAEAAASWFGRKARLAYLSFEEWEKTVSERDASLTRDHAMHSPHASIAKARRVLGFEPRFTAVEAARDAVTAMSL